MTDKGEQSKQSLASLTQGFIHLLTNSEDVEIEITKASEMLDASKRRLYDVTNVLQGVGLVERCGKSKIKWTSRNSKADAQSYHNALLEKEKELIQISSFLDAKIEEFTNSEVFNNLGWVTDFDIQKCKKDRNSKVFALKGPASLAVQVDETEDGTYRMVCQSEDQPISWTPIGRN
ncbi:hypothetical protein TVAG_427230 [Trichomonas vaginalis G3]|uniref:E2F/DP family winged-helix DNA-binding domain-containing protein n=1 Tax=Trichomonas vaginalis (strain ATCC PRA-98 / G3) TaxID=412133 RepID=A2FNA5_TRIV3|nr:protein dimerization protein [Trichomonas vaginalis G3]EAX93601.1 hypothetical protein TVAG_427230 [Trichomonas vaginalis G3]KAI5546406.1 protein dimerization protein [Trichomonas vaginalis G3]|eukprot:XP_001306531.1 hypothetical protein [Trichomonas vaginalis G3]